MLKMVSLYVLRKNIDMSFKILEENICPKHNSLETCEDRIVYNENFACIIDGATSKSVLRYNAKSSALRVSEILEKEILRLEKESNLPNTVETLSNAIRSYYVRHNLLDYMFINPIDRLTASVIIYSKHFSQIWLIGDCQCLVNYQPFSHTKKIDILLSEIRSLYISNEILMGKTIKQLQQTDTGREYILPLLKAQSYYQNSKISDEYCYSAIDGFDVNLSQVLVINVSTTDTITLASDGYPKLFDKLDESENYLKSILEKDPLCYKLFKSTKGKYLNDNSYDDRAYLRFKNH